MTRDDLVSALNRQSDEIASLTKTVRLVVYVLAALCLLVFVDVVVGDDQIVIRADRSQWPKSKLKHIFYLRLDSVHPGRRLQLQRAMDFTVASCSSQPILERSLPVKLSETLYRIDLEELGWEALPKIIRDHYPYRSPRQVRSNLIPAAFRADWFVGFVLDQKESDAYLQLLFGNDVPKNRVELKKKFEIAENELVNNWVEDDSGVAVNKTRLLKAYPSTLRSDVWQTFDFADLNLDTDPLQNFDSNLDGAFSEWIAPLIKVSLTTGEQGHLQQYALTDNEGNVAPAAPIDVVVDHTGINGTPELVNPISCIGCHSEGLRPLSTNSVRRFVEANVDGVPLARIAPKSREAREKIERQFLGKLQNGIDVHNQKYATIVRLITGGTPKDVSADIAAVVRGYNNRVDFKTAARELGVSTRQFELALATSGSVPARLAQLPAVPMSREQWEVIYLQAKSLVDGRRRLVR